MRIIVLNAPPSSGKGVAQDVLARFEYATPMSFKTPLVQLTKTIYGITDQQWDSWYQPEEKEVYRDELDSLSCREALIHVSEDIIKPNFGEDYFGKMMVKSIYNDTSSYTKTYVIDDGGFDHEIIPLMEEFGRRNLYLITIERDGHSFVNDSRNWLDKKFFHACGHITNDGDLSTFQGDVLSLYKALLH